MNTTVLKREASIRPARTARRLSSKRLGLMALAFAATGGGAWYAHEWWTQSRFVESTDDAYVGGDITTIAPRVSGIIAEVDVTDNQAVRAGDVLLRIDDRDYRASLAKAKAAVAGAEASLVDLAARRRLQQAVIAEAHAAIAAAEAEVVRARDDQVRYSDLATKAAASVQSFQKADADYKRALAEDERSEAALQAAQRQLDVIDAQKQQADAALGAAIADREAAEINLGYTVVRAPIDGTVGNRSAHPGGYAAAGAQLISEVPAHGLWVDANFKESQLGHMRPGMAATIEADVLPGRELHGHVVSLAPATGAEFSVLPPENATGNFTRIVQRVPVRIALDGETANLGVLRPGLSVTAWVDERDDRR